MHSQVLEPSHLDMLTRVLHHAASRTGINSTRTMRRTSPLTLVYLFQRAMVNEFDLDLGAQSRKNLRRVG